MNTKLWDAWLEFATEAMKGTEQARRTFESMTFGASGADDLSKWLRQWYPQGAANPKDLAEVVETWWSTVGGVPRQRYEEVLKQNEKLWAQLKEAEATIGKLRDMMVQDTARKTQEQATVLLNEWEKTTRDVMNAQAEIARKWSEGLFGGSAKGEEQ